MKLRQRTKYKGVLVAYQLEVHRYYCNECGYELVSTNPISTKCYCGHEAEEKPNVSSFCISWTTYRKLLFERDNYKCQLCGLTSHLQIHHVNHNIKNAGEYNLLTLCQGCNVTVNYNREEWARKLLCIVQAKPSIDNKIFTNLRKFYHCRFSNKVILVAN